ncbi:MAG: Panacea domain-containing protein [Pseudomonadota bacterium]
MERFDREKFKNLMHHVIWRTQTRDGWGLVKTFKALWFFEARCFTLRGDVFSGAKYVKDQFGPRPLEAYQIISELVSERKIATYEEAFFDFSLKRAKALKAPLPGLLNETEAEDLNFWINYIDGKTASEISDESHDLGWEIAKQGSELPLYALLAQRVRDPDSNEMAWAKRRAEELQLP